MATAKAVPQLKVRKKKQATASTSKTKPTEPKKLSKVGEWMRAHPHGLDVIYIDWKAALK